jgi:hypothetical protein
MQVAVAVVLKNQIELLVLAELAAVVMVQKTLLTQVLD